MAEKEEGNTTLSETPKSEEAASAPASEETLTSLETIAEVPTVRNEVPQATAQVRAKIDVVLRATGNAPIMKQRKWTVYQDQPIGSISEFIRRYLKLQPSERLFLYVHQTFAPAPDQTIKNLYDCFGADGKLVINYCQSQAWG